VNPALVGVALAVVLGGAIATSARNARTAVLGLVVALLGAAFVADPPPDSLGLAARLVGVVLGGYLMWIAGRGAEARTGGSRLGWPTELLVAAAGGVVGYASYGLGAPASGPALAQAAGVALAALAIAPLVNGRDVMRIGIGIHLLAGGAVLLRTALDGTPDPSEQLVTAGLFAALGGTVAAIAMAARSADVAGFELMPGQGDRSVRAPDAHPLEPR
jgi:hypothetical protein